MKMDSNWRESLVPSTIVLGILNVIGSEQTGERLLHRH